MKKVSISSPLTLLSCLLLASVSISSAELLYYLYGATAVAFGGYTLVGVWDKIVNKKPAKIKAAPVTRPMDSDVLLVDDDQDVLDTIEQVFNQAGVSVIKALNGKDALAIVAKNHVGVVVSDIYMPGMGGFDLVRKIKSEVVNPPALFLMTGTLNPSQEKAIEAGAQSVFDKFHIDSALLDTVRAEIQSHRSAA